MKQDSLLKNKIESQYIFARINHNEKGGEWTALVTAVTNFPTYLIFDNQLLLKGMFTGYVNKSTFLSRINQINQGKIVCDLENLFQKGVLKEIQPISPEHFLEAIQNNMQALYYLDQYHNQNKKSSQDSVMLHLQKSVKLFPDIYNQYLLASLYIVKWEIQSLGKNMLSKRFI